MHTVTMEEMAAALIRPELYFFPFRATGVTNSEKLSNLATGVLTLLSGVTWTSGDKTRNATAVGLGTFGVTMAVRWLDAILTDSLYRSNTTQRHGLWQHYAAQGALTLQHALSSLM